MKTEALIKKTNDDMLDVISTERVSDKAARDAILRAIRRQDCHTFRQIREATGLPDAVLHFELKVLTGIEISVRDEPPVTTWWDLGKIPKGKIYIGAGGRVMIAETEEPKDFKQEIQERNKEIKKTALTASDKKTPAGTKPVMMMPFASSGESRQNKTAVRRDEAKNKAADGAPAASEIYVKLPLEVVNLHPDNPRTVINLYEQSFIDLTDSIREQGIQEPLIVTPNADRKSFRIVMGNRRRMAAEKAGLTEVPCIVRQYPSIDVEIEVMLIENIQRENLKPSQEAKAFHRLLQKSKDIHAVARRVGLKQSYINNRLKLLQLDPLIRRMIDDGELSLSAGIELAALPIEQQKKLVPRAPRLKTDELRLAVRKLKEGFSHKLPKKENKSRVTTEEEKFTRSGAIAALKKLGEAWFAARHIINSFDDVCLDSCLESKDETLCHSCPVPRFVSSLTRRVGREVV